MTRILSGKETAAAIQEKIREKCAVLKERGIVPKLLLIRVGERPDDVSYERSIIRCAGRLGVETDPRRFPPDVDAEELLSLIDEANRSQKIHGIMMLRPLPKTLPENVISEAVSPAKDVDGITLGSLAGVMTGRNIGFSPCTAEACIRILRHYNIDCRGKRAVVIGRSLVVGRPAAMQLLAEDATVTICHSRTLNLRKTCREPEILIACAGTQEMVGDEFLSEGQIVIDVGIHFRTDGKMVGDVDFNAANGKVAAITPVPGGVGAVTTTLLISHVVEAAGRLADAAKEGS